VKQNGVDIGQVTAIRTDSADIRKSVVHFKVAAGTPMKTDMVATMGSYGITGLKYLEITGGSYDSPDVPKGGEIRSNLSMIGRLALRADSIATKVDMLLGNAIAMTEAGNRRHLDRLMESSASLSQSLDSLARDLQGVRPGPRMQAILSNADAAAKEIREKIRKTDVAGTLTEYRRAAQDMQKAAQSLDATVRRTHEDLAVALSSLKETMKNMNTFSRQIKDNPSVLLRGVSKQERRQ
jgi:phospholipid/cholesterol/gamma-HCH transport system substrate-binding protein